MKNYLEGMMRKLEFPEEAIVSLLASFDELQGKKTLDTLLDFVGKYERDEDYNIYGSIDVLADAAKADGLPWQPSQMIYYLFLMRHLEDKYEKLGYDKDIYYHSILDMKWKMFECRECDGIWGSNVGGWDVSFYIPTLFGIGRLEFEIEKMGVDCEVGGRKISKDDTVVNIHIPSAGPLLPELCLDAFKGAHKFFADKFKDGITVFHVESWLVYPGHREFLPETSNILKFMDFFKIVSSYEEEPNASWRIFGHHCGKPFSELPTDTGLRRAYVGRLLRGEPVGGGIGAFLFDGENIIND